MGTLMDMTWESEWQYKLQSGSVVCKPRKHKNQYLQFFYLKYIYFSAAFNLNTRSLLWDDAWIKILYTIMEVFYAFRIVKSYLLYK